MTHPFLPYSTPISEVEGLLLISASAGTGKTWMITHLAARWLLEENREPSEVLMVTFSRAAAAELKYRLRTRFEEIGVVLDSISESSVASHSELDEPTWEQALAATARTVGLEELRARFRRIFSALDGVHARTIHSFASAARQQPEASIVAGTNLRRRAVQEVITRHGTARSEGFLALLDVLESSPKATKPGAEILADQLLKALMAAESAGGVASGRVTLWRSDEETDDEAVLLVAEQLLREGSERLERLRQLEQEISFDGLIEQLHAEVTEADSTVAARLREQFGLVLIDEFQDTDALQWQIFDAVFRRGPKPTPLIIVGDPKQAIYGFRGGDVSVFQRLRSDVRASSEPNQRSYELALTTNYRSSKSLLGALNTLFTHGPAGAWTFSSDEVAPITYEPVVASPAHQTQPGHLELRVGESLSRPEICADVGLVLDELTATHGVAAHDIAVLCRRRSTVEALQRYLDRKRVPTVALGTSSVYLSLAATQLRTLLWILGDSSNPRRANLLAATWFRSLGSGTASTLRDHLQRRGVAALQRRALGGDVLAEILALARGERHWTDVEHLFELLAASCAGGVAADELLRHLDGCIADAHDGTERDDAAQRRVESDGEAVQLMTIHAAKGLEFPVVLVPDIESVHRPPGQVTSWTTPQGRTIDANTIINRTTVSTIAATAQADEDRRLMYVALTRAQRVLFAWVADDKGQWPQLVQPVLTASPELSTPSDIFPRSAPSVSACGEPVALPSDLTPPRSPVRTSGPPELRSPLPQFREITRRWSYSSLVLSKESADHRGGDGRADSSVDAGANGEDVELAPVHDDAFAEVFGSLRGAELGNAVHQVFERAVGTCHSTNTDTLGQLVNDAWTEYSLGVVTSGIEEVFVGLLSRSMGPLFDDRAFDDFVGRAATSAEMRFTMPLQPSRSTNANRLAQLGALVVARDPDGPYTSFFAELASSHADENQLLDGYLTGSIDLVAQIGDAAAARYVIVDYKTNLLKEASTYEPTDLTSEMAHSGYPLQGLLYEVALHRFLRGRLGDYDPARHLGGLCYLYVRGAARPATPASGLAPWRVPASVVVGASEILDGATP